MRGALVEQARGHLLSPGSLHTFSWFSFWRCGRQVMRSQRKITRLRAPAISRAKRSILKQIDRRRSVFSLRSYDGKATQGSLKSLKALNPAGFYSDFREDANRSRVFNCTRI